jgi:hypothetical protein
MFRNEETTNMIVQNKKKLLKNTSFYYNRKEPLKICVIKLRNNQWSCTNKAIRTTKIQCNQPNGKIDDYESTILIDFMLNNYHSYNTIADTDKDINSKFTIRISSRT